GSLPFDIQLRERFKLLRPNRRRVFQYLRGGFLFGLVIGLVIGPFIGLDIVSDIRLIIVLGLIGVLIGVLGGFIIAFLDTPAVDKRPYPGSGVRASLNYAFLMSIFVYIFAFLLFVLLLFLLPNLLDYFKIFLPPVFTWFGGLAWC